jgi:hypothetical protein
MNQKETFLQEYCEFLSNELRMVQIELWGQSGYTLGWCPINTAAKRFHFEDDWREIAPPSTRAEYVLAAAWIARRKSPSDWSDGAILPRQ